MSDIFARWDNEMNVEALKNEVADIQSNNMDFEQAPHGEYEVKIAKLEIKASKKGDPMLSAWFKVVEEGKKHLSFNMNQLLIHKYSIKNAMDFLRSLKSGRDIKFESYGQFAALVADVFNEIDGSKEYLIQYGQNDKGYDTFFVTDVFSI